VGGLPVEKNSFPVVESRHIKDKRTLASYATLGDDIKQEIRNYVGEMDPITAEEAADMRRVIATVTDKLGDQTVLCGDGCYREAPFTARIVAESFAIPGTYTFSSQRYPSAEDTYDIEIQGAGGGGGSHDGASIRGGGGGAGAYTLIRGVTLTNKSVTVTVGRGGEGGLGTDGKDGGASTFGGFIAEGGNGGSGGPSCKGGKGAAGFWQGCDGSDGDADTHGRGGDSWYGSGAEAVVGNEAANGNDAAAAGAGGSGASSEGGAYDKKGGCGGDGRVVVYRYITSPGEVVQ